MCDPCPLFLRFLFSGPDLGTKSTLREEARVIYGAPSKIQTSNSLPQGSRLCLSVGCRLTGWASQLR